MTGHLFLFTVLGDIELGDPIGCCFGLSGKILIATSGDVIDTEMEVVEKVERAGKPVMMRVLIESQLLLKLAEQPLHGLAVRRSRVRSPSAPP